jgi:hypothetical protein
MNNTVPFKALIAGKNNFCIVDTARLAPNRFFQEVLQYLSVVLSFKKQDEETTMNSAIDILNGLSFYNELEWNQINIPDCVHTLPEEPERELSLAWEVLRGGCHFFTVVIITTKENNFNYIIY